MLNSTSISRSGDPFSPQTLHMGRLVHDPPSFYWCGNFHHIFFTIPRCKIYYGISKINTLRALQLINFFTWAPCSPHGRTPYMVIYLYYLSRAKLSRHALRSEWPFIIIIKLSRPLTRSTTRPCGKCWKHEASTPS